MSFSLCFGSGSPASPDSEMRSGPPGGRQAAARGALAGAVGERALLVRYRHALDVSTRQTGRYSRSLSSLPAIGGTESLLCSFDFLKCVSP